MATAPILQFSPELKAQIEARVKAAADAASTTKVVDTGDHGKWLTEINAKATVIATQWNVGLVKMESLKDEIGEIQQAFKKLKKGETICGQTSFDAFCNAQLHRSRQAVYAMLDKAADKRPPSAYKRDAVMRRAALAVGKAIEVISLNEPTLTTDEIWGIVIGIARMAPTVQTKKSLSLPTTANTVPIVEGQTVVSGTDASSAAPKTKAKKNRKPRK
jgi:hypothetical protein